MFFADYMIPSPFFLMKTDSHNPTYTTKAPKNSAYDVVIGEQGLGAIRHTLTGETMHSRHDPCEEAGKLYVEQANILERVKSNTNTLTIWDVGLGAATNAMQCIHAVEKATENHGSVAIYSFEIDLDPLRLALAHSSVFPYIRHPGPETLYKTGEWTNQNQTISWKLIRGDFLSNLHQAPIPDIIWYDPFSYKVDSTPWTTEAFTQILRTIQTHPTILYTYTASTAIRAGMLLSGWYVGVGCGTTTRRQSTVAFSPSQATSLQGEVLLDRHWVTKWEKSSAKRPFGNVPDDYECMIRHHPQFSGNRL